VTGGGGGDMVVEGVPEKYNFFLRVERKVKA